MNKRILKLLEQRLEHGKKEYDDELNVHDGRDWHIEALEEALDGCIYIACSILKILDKRKEIK